MEMLEASGYSLEWTERILLGAIKGYARVLSTCSQEDLPRNRPGWRSKVGRRYKKIMGPAEWFKQQKGEDNVGAEVVGEPSKNEQSKPPQAKNENEFTKVLLGNR